MDKYCVYNMKLAGFLMLNGFRIYRIEHDLKHPGRDVYIFKDTPQLQKQIEIYKFNKEDILNGINYEGSND